MKSVKLVQPVPARVAGGSEKNRNADCPSSRAQTTPAARRFSGREDGALQPSIARCEISLLARYTTRPHIHEDDAAPVVVQPPASSVALQEFGYAVAYASGKFVVGARELGDDKVGAAFLYSL